MHKTGDNIMTNIYYYNFKLQKEPSIVSNHSKPCSLKRTQREIHLVLIFKYPDWNYSIPLPSSFNSFLIITIVSLASTKNGGENVAL